MCLKFFSWNVRVSDVNFLMIRKMCAKNPFPIKHVLTTWNTAYMPLSIKSTSMNNKNWYRGIMQSGYFLLRQKFGCQADQIQLSGTCRNRTRRLSLCLSLSVLNHQFTCCLTKYWAPDWALWVTQQSYAEFDSVTSFLYPQTTGDKWHSMTIHGRFVSPKFTQSWKVFSFKRTLVVRKKTSEQAAFEAFPLDTPFTFVLMNLRHVGSQLLTFHHDQFQPFGSVD